MTDNWLWTALTILAIIAGPIGALLVSRYLDNSRAEKAARMDIFRTLMRTRSLPLSWEHVQALNLVELEFRNHTRVIDARKNYLKILNEPIPTAEEQESFHQFLNRRNKLLTLLIDEIAKTLNVKVKQLDIYEGNYVPKAWDDEEWDKALIRRGLIEVLTGITPIWVKSQQEQPGNTLEKVHSSSKSKLQ